MKVYSWFLTFISFYYRKSTKEEVLRENTCQVPFGREVNRIKDWNWNEIENDERYIVLLQVYRSFTLHYCPSLYLCHLSLEASLERINLPKEKYLSILKVKNIESGVFVGKGMKRRQWYNLETSTQWSILERWTRR